MGAVVAGDCWLERWLLVGVQWLLVRVVVRWLPVRNVKTGYLECWCRLGVVTNLTDTDRYSFLWF
ncbi:hypothetical protein Hdeb2414_s0842g00952931 [Helianthus debilis subsp. tardiflorus]